MAEWSEIPALELKVGELAQKCAEKGILLSHKKEIPYGTQIHCEGTELSGTVTLYHSKKKGFSAVNNSKNDVTLEVCNTFLGKTDDSRPFRPRIGSDEAGKGDFFGPLVAAAFYIETEDMEKELLQIGIRDSKRLTDKKIQLMAFEIKKRWPDHCEILSPSVEKYNSLYSTIGNLNRQLGWMHGRILANIGERFYKDSKIETIVDKFADVNNVTSSVGGLERLDISAIIHGEDAELAIAAASVLARDRFVLLMKKQNKSYELDFPFGASEKVKEVGTQFISKYGRNKLHEVAKTHFKTANEI